MTNKVLLSVLFLSASSCTSSMIYVPVPTASPVVVQNQCNDLTKNGIETDSDCGGLYCRGCSMGKMCLANADCVSRYCLNGVCSAPSCFDDFNNGSETGVDCGGDCAPCPGNGACASNADCAVGESCVAGACTVAN